MSTEKEETLFRDKQVTADVKRKVISEKRAHELVKQLLEEEIESKFFADAVHFLSAQHYQDVNEERSILKLCGYPLCDRALSKVLKQQYRIVSNRVFDLSQRKLFCSDRCYRASEHVKGQISTTPLWLRDPERIVPIDLDTSGAGSKGEEVLLQLRVPSDSDEEQSQDSSPTSCDEDEIEVDPLVDASEQLDQHRTSPVPPLCPNASASVHRSPTHDPACTKDAQSRLSALDHVMMTCREWLTEKSLVYLGLITQRPLQEAHESSDDVQLRKMKKLELLEKNLNMVVKGFTDSASNSEMPLAPDTAEEDTSDTYRQRIELFYKGRIGSNDRVRFKESEPKKQPPLAPLPVYPRVDSKNQRSIRRNILHEKLAKICQELFPGLPPTVSGRDLKTLISTFNLTSSNVIMKTNQYPLATIVLLLLLSRRSESVQNCLHQSEALISRIFTAYQLKLSTLQRTLDDVIESVTVECG